MKPTTIETIFSEMNYCELCMSPIGDDGGYTTEELSNGGVLMKMRFHSHCHLSLKQLQKKIDIFKNLTEEQLEKIREESNADGNVQERLE